MILEVVKSGVQPIWLQQDSNTLLGQSSFEEAGGLEDLRQVTFIEVYENLNSVTPGFNSHEAIFLNSASTNVMSLIMYVRMTKQYKLVNFFINTYLGYNCGLLEMAVVTEILQKKCFSTKICWNSLIWETN